MVGKWRRGPAAACICLFKADENLIPIGFFFEEKWFISLYNANRANKSKKSIDILVNCMYNNQDVFQTA